MSDCYPTDYRSAHEIAVANNERKHRQPSPLAPSRCWLSAHESERLVVLIRQALNMGLGPSTAKELEQYANLIKARSAQGSVENRQPTANDKLSHGGENEQ